MASVESGDVGLTELAHRQRHSPRFAGTDKQVHVVAHQYVGVNLQVVAFRALAQQTEIVPTVVIVQKDRASIHSALSEMQWNSGDFQTSLAGHVIGRRRDCPSVDMPSAESHRRDDLSSVGAPRP
jgi:hypothetical protein